MLPAGWMFKVIWEGFTKDKEWSQSLRFLSREGSSMDSMKAALGLLNSDPGSYNQSDVDNCKEFMKEQTCPEKKFSWLDGEDSLPAGWRYRVSEGDAKMEWFLSPEGRMYRSRYTAVSDMVKNKERVENVEEMKVLMERHEGWERSKLLPAGWLFKVKSEGYGPNNKWYSIIHYLAAEGVTFESMKSVLDFIQTSGNYSEQDVENGKAFLAEQKAPEKKYEWKEGDETVPGGWKTRVSEGDSKMEWILSPEGRMYRTRYTAVLDMIKRGQKHRLVEEMKEKMVAVEGWESSDLLPSSWLFKVIWEGFTQDQKWSQTIRFLSREGEVLESMKSVLELLEGRAEYSEEDRDSCREFLKLQKAPEKKYQWSGGGDSLPQGWRRRVGEGEVRPCCELILDFNFIIFGSFQAKWEWVLSPEGRMYRSRFVALQDMVSRQRPLEVVSEIMPSGEEALQRGGRGRDEGQAGPGGAVEDGPPPACRLAI